MKKTLHSLLAILLLNSYLYAGYVPLTISSGLNADVIADGVGTVNSRTNNAVDDGPFAFVELGWKLNASSTPLAYGLPTNRQITNGAISYLLAPYDGNNAARINTNNSNHQINFQPPYAFGSKLYMLATGGSGAATVSVIIRFSDNTTQTHTGIVIQDWFNGTPFVLGGIGRVGTTSNVPENPGNGPRLYQYEINIDAANQTKSIVGVTINKTSTGTGIANIFGFNLKESSVYNPFQIATGFNADVIAEGTGTALAKTTNDVDGVNYVFVAQGWQFSASNTPTTSGLPTNRIINSAIDNGLSYILAPYDQNNTLRIDLNNTPHTLTFSTPQTAEVLYLLNTTGSGTANMNATVNFADNTSQTFTNLATLDWFYATPFETNNIGRVLRNATTTTVETNTGGPRMYRSVLALNPTNYNKNIVSITITRTSASGNDTKLNIFAVTGEKKLALNCTEPTAISATNITPYSAQLNWSSNANATQWQIIYGPTGFNPTNQGNRFITNTNPYNLTTLNPVTTYDVYIRSICTNGDTSAASNVYSFTTACVPPALPLVQDSFVCESGSVLLTASAQAATIRWYDANTGGSLINTGNNFTTPNISTTTTYYVSSFANNCESTRVPITASVRPKPLINLGNDTTICLGASIVLDASTNANNRTYKWYNNAITPTIAVNQPNIYTVTVTEQQCSNTDTIIITAGIEPTPTLLDSTGLCDGSSMLLNAGNSGATYLWNDNSTAQTLLVSTNGIYTVTITSPDQCSVKDSTYVSTRALPIAPFNGGNRSKCENELIVLDAGNSGDTYLWNTGAYTQTINVIDSGIYQVLIKNQYGCERLDSIKVNYFTNPKSNGFTYIPKFYDELGEVEFSIINPVAITNVMWDFGDGQQSTQLNPIHKYSIIKEYNVSLTVYNNCDSAAYTQTIQLNSGTSNNKVEVLNLGFDLYPNPAQNVLQLKPLSIKVNDIYLYNSVGQKIKANIISNHNESIILDIQLLHSGAYHVEVVTDHGSIRKRFIKH